MDFRAACFLPLLVYSSTSPTVTQEADGVDPWSINQNICPPILCGPVSEMYTQGAPSGTVALEPTSNGISPFFEGDIVLGADQKDKMSRKTKKRKKKTKILTDPSHRRRNRGKRAIVKPLDKHWQYGQVPYKIDQAFNDKTQELIHRAHRHIEEQTCIQFRPKMRGDKDYLMYIYQPGCWSYVGRTGGEQTVSLGSGCEQLGTAVHETCHALGFWHEQSRADRDRYVRILTENVAASGKAQFGKRSRSESFSLGYAYDYQSIMHYGEKYFSSNGRDTIKLKGVGEKLGFKIGQRKGLSEIDAAQLKDMYFCNSKDQSYRVCGKGWEPYDGRCYKFETSDKQTYSGARAACAYHGAGLVHITTSTENKFISRVIEDHYHDVKKWRIGAKKIGSDLMWEDPFGKRHRPIKYSRWAPGHPGSYTTAILALNSSRDLVWKATWAGSPSKPDKFAYPYICERKDYKCSNGWVNLADKCYLFERDKQSFDRARKGCGLRLGHLLHINSKEEDAFIKSYLIDNYPSSEKWRAGVSNKGRRLYWNGPDNKYKKIRYQAWSPNQPGTLTNMALTRYDGSPKRFVWKGTSSAASNVLPYICEKQATENCFKSRTRDGRDYRGKVSYSEQGVSCQSWSSQYPHNHDYLTGQSSLDIREGLADHNYCRNPYGRRARPWCYVPLKATKWQYCDITVCK